MRQVQGSVATVQLSSVSVRFCWFRLHLVYMTGPVYQFRQRFGQERFNNCWNQLEPAKYSNVSFTATHDHFTSSIMTVYLSQFTLIQPIVHVQVISLFYWLLPTAQVGSCRILAGSLLQATRTDVGVIAAMAQTLTNLLSSKVIDSNPKQQTKMNDYCWGWENH